MKPFRVIHFVSGGGSGSTFMAMLLAFENQQSSLFEPILIFRRKSDFRPELYKMIEEKGIRFYEVCESPKYKTVSQLVKIIREVDPHIFVSHGFSEHIWGRLAARIAKIPVNIQVEHNAEKYKPHYYLYSRLLGLCTNKIVCVSEGVRKHQIKLGFNADVMRVIYNGINVRQFLPPADWQYECRQDKAVMVARFARQKNQETLLKAANLLRDWQKQVEILFVGQGNNRYYQRNKKLSRKLGLDDRVHFLGSLPLDEVKDILVNNKIFVLSTHYEGLPLSIVEAMASGCVVIASNVAGVSELIDDGRNGYLVPPGDPQALAQKILYVLDHEEIAAQVADKGQKYALEFFTVERMAQEYEALFIEELKKCGKM